MKKILSISLAAIMISSLAACGNSSSTPQTKAVETQAETKAEETKAEETKAEEAKEGTEAAGEKAAADYHIGIVTGSVSQSEDVRRGAQAFQAE